MSDKKIKLAIVINDLNIGGAEKLVVDQLKHFNREKFELCLITMFDFPNEKDFFSSVPKDVLLYRLNFKSFKDIRSWRSFTKAIKEFRPDVVISHLFFCNTVTRILKPFYGYRAIAVEHNTYIFKTRSQILTDKFLSRFSYKLVAVSKTVADYASKQAGIPRDKFVVIHNGIDTSKIKENLSSLIEMDELKERLGFNKQDKIFLNVARMVQQKDQELLIRSFAEFYKYHKEYRLVILGDGGLREKLVRLVSELDVKDVVKMPGVMNPIPYYATSEALFSTSKIEGLSIAYLEALACGLPIIATKTAGTDEIVKDGKNGFYITEHSVECVVQNFEKLVSSDIEKLKKEAVNTSTKFDIMKNIEEYESLTTHGLS